MIRKEKMIRVERILVIDDDHDSGQLVIDAAEAKGIECVATATVSDFIKKFSADTTLIFLDLVMPEVDGIELLRVLGQARCSAGIVLMSGVDKRVIETAKEWAETLGLSVIGHLQKPFRLNELEGIFETSRALQTSAVVDQGPRVIIEAADFKRAIERNEFVLHYQPKISLKNGGIVGLEALVRWQHPECGLIFPNDFIRRIEALGLIDQLGWIVVNKGLRDIGEFVEAAGTSLMLSLNISTFSIHDPGFPDMLLSLLQKYGVSVHNLIFEITESGLIQKLSNTLDDLSRLRTKQVQLSIDDFGTGYSTMQQLRSIAATELKIDKGFVKNIHANNRDRLLVQKTIEIGHDLGMTVVAEGVETAEQLAFLRLKGCDIVQGYFFCRPLPAEELLKWLRSHQLTKLRNTG
jgi:EAL domain-containing protein (putative c-di-GMP-specific phosphodiesterase class I)/ActR/RegA family two-component response regulator